MRKHLKLFQFKSIQTKMLVVILLFLVLPLVILSYTYTRTTELVIQEEIERENTRMLEQINRELEVEIKRMMNAANYFSLSKSIKQVLFEGDIDYSINYKSAEQQYYKNFVIVNESIEMVQNTMLLGNTYYITLFDLHGNNYTSQPKRDPDKDNAWRKTEWFAKTIELNGYMLWTFHKDDRTGEYLITVSRLINESIDNKWSGVITITATAEKLFSDRLIEYNMDELFIMEHSGKIISHSSVENIGESISGNPLYSILLERQGSQFVKDKVNGKRFITNKIIESTGWHLVNISDYNTLFHRLIRTRTFNFIMMGIVLVFFICVTYIIILRVIGPLKELMTSMQQVEQGNFNFSISVSGEDEIAKLGSRFNKMVQKINLLIQNIQEKQKEEEELKLQVLYAQINPHFLFNTLNTIKWIAVINQSNNVAKLIGDLGRLLETSIKGIERPITLQEELDNLNSYLSLQQARYNKRYNYINNMSDNIVECLVPKLILQPIIENSLIHGLEKNRDGNMTIKLNGEIRGDNRLWICIEDDGVGIEEHVLETILQQSKSKRKSTQFSAIGLNNVHQRIRMMFGEAYGLQVYSKVGEGTQVNIWLPIEKEADDDTSYDCG